MGDRAGLPPRRLGMRYRRTGDRGCSGGETGQAAEHRRVASAAASHGGLGGELLAIYHGEVNEDSDGPVEVCAPVARPDAVPSGMAIRARPRTGRPMPRSPVRSSNTRRSCPPMTRSRTGSARLDWPGRARPARSTCKAWTLRRRHPANPSATSPTPSGARGRCTSGRR
jgi:hypothetical protein